MQLIDGHPVYSATDLVGYLACPNLTALDRAVLGSLVKAPHIRDAELVVLQRRGYQHERRYLDELTAQGRTVVSIESATGAVSYADRLRSEAAATQRAMAAGADVIYQATFFDGTWVGHADFLLRVERQEVASAFGGYHYEVADTKLARHVKASALLQICSYVDQLQVIQGTCPEQMHVVLGGNPRRTESFRVADFMAYYRMVRSRFEQAVGPNAAPVAYPLPTVPEPVEHCDVCRWKVDCAARRREADHLSLVAGISRNQRRELEGRGVTTLTGLGELPLPITPPPQRTSRAALTRVREQARIQLEGRRQNQALHELLLPVEANQGLAALLPPSPGDLFLDLEGDPFAFDNGLDYLFGIMEPRLPDTLGNPTYYSFWSTDANGDFSLDGERVAFEKAIDLIMDRLARDSHLHVYHYAPYEPSAFKRLMGRYGTREEEVDALLRGGVFVDLYRVVRQALRASVESYSIKKLEPLYGLERSVGLRDAGSSIAEFEAWLQLSEGEQPGADHLDKILDYNRDDVLSTWRLRDWLEQRRAELVASGSDVPRPAPADPEPPPDLSQNLRRTAELAERLTDGVSADPELRSPEQQARWLLAQLLSWHRRESKSTWWLYFHLMNDLTDDERIEAKEPLGGLEFLQEVEPIKQSRVYRYRFPPQEHSIELGTAPQDPATHRGAGTVVAIDEAERTIDLSRGKSNTAPHPTALVPLQNVDTGVLQESLLRLGAWVADRGMDGPGPYRAARDLLLGLRPRTAGSVDEGDGGGESSLQRPEETAIAAACRLVGSLDHSTLPIQGPPGAGKTYTAAHMILALLADGRKVGVTANSHKVISNVLKAVCELADEKDQGDVRAIQKADEDGSAGHDDSRIEQTKDAKAVASALATGQANLAAGTAWVWARPDMVDAVDVLFIDEAGQFSLANAVAVAPAGRSLILLGDPQQLDQPLQGVHPPGADASALGHLLGGHATMPLDRGLFLATTWRLHPNIAAFTSEAFYDAKLESEGHLAGQRLDAAQLQGAGLWLTHVAHHGRDNESEEEAAVVADLARSLVEGTAHWTDKDLQKQEVTWADVLIVAPYNAQVGAIRRLLPPEARVGTVDKFQGQEAPVSIYAMTTSSPEEAPRGMSFLYSRNRLNVATSRARCAAILVCSPDLLRVEARTPEQMRLANALCQFVERADCLTQDVAPEPSMQDVGGVG